MNTEPLVSVIICIYNAGAYLRSAVQSILDQNYRNLEVLIIDDGSTDGCMDTIANSSDPRIRRFSQPNQGKSVALNRALDEMRGDFYAIQDADDLSNPRRIERQVRCMQENPDVAAVFCGNDLIAGDERRAPRFSTKDRAECARDITNFRMPALDPTAMYRRSLVGDLRYEEQLPIVEGFDYILRVGEKHPLVVMGECLYSYRVHLGSITRTDPLRRERLVAEVIRTARERRGMGYDAALKDCSRRRRSQNELADNNLAAHFIESAVDQARAGRRLGAIRTGLECMRLHPLDPHYHKAWILAATPLFMHRYLRRSGATA